MLIYAGIDETGYGPMLGPLCVAASVFVVDGHDPATGAPDLWKRLSSVVCRASSDRRRRIAVEDSKKLKTANDGKAHPLRHLERGVLSFLAAAADDATSILDALPVDDDALFAAVGAVPPSATDAPWYGPCATGSALSLPLAHERDDLSIAAARLRRAMGDAGARCLALRCACVDAGEFNRRIAMARNKATVSFDSIVALLDGIWNDAPAIGPDGPHPRVVIDRQGGRAHYLDPLRMCFPDAEITVLGESDAVSRYRLVRDRRDGAAAVTVSFESESEQRHLPVALASMTAKLVRELMMARLNRWFAVYRPEIKPTAGYVQDGRRWLAEMEPVLAALSVNREALVRNG